MMNVSINGRKVKLTPDLRKYVEKNLKKLDHYSDHILDFKLILKKERHVYLAEVNINVKRKLLYIFAKSEDVFSVIDTLFDKIDAKLGRYWDKLTRKRVVPMKESLTEAEEAVAAART
jgi:ribosomal subunit interface protein